MGRHALIGHTGFVGANLAHQHRFDANFNSKNIWEIHGSSFELLVIAGVQAKKWWANLHPQEDWAQIQSLLDPLAKVQAAEVVLISTIDVLPLHAGTNEDTDPHFYENHAYGRHRLRVEDRVRSMFDVVKVVRLPGLFGAGLKKNVIYDLLNSNQLEKINPSSTIQYYDLGRLWQDIELLRKNPIDLVHLFTEPVKTETIVNCFFQDVVVGRDAGPEVHYDLRTKYGPVFGGVDGYIETADQVLERMSLFISDYRTDSMT
ncbi:MAG TPA: hypothetical protein DDY14_08595 [Chromatiaceae bacterium]|jgi:hypothetical protein|nr:MAG: hypothetical protein N838_12130 [Thiohalocapsa sp. PB-PSB1]QQO56926.1 MAG: hypothetical protein N838_29780 [Thiohalocapsa sp. PB-PSB1]HBG95366.1 hypothetical protein [Chromatiaceae bacterium]HCS91921.1 hypothetical protein [Chromatiaceae bacterium]